MEGVEYEEATVQLQAGDQMIFYTDGITEALNDERELFGTERLDAVLGNCGAAAEELIQIVLDSVEKFTQGRPADDDRTMVVARVV